MGSQERKATIAAPVKAILTDAGTTFFINNKKNLKKIRLSDQSQEYGFLLDDFSPGSLQRLILIGYISKIELAGREFASIRQEVIDICKLVTYSMMYRQYDALAFHRLMTSEVVKNWNRMNLANSLDENATIDEAVLNTLLSGKEKTIASIKQSILSPMHAYISKNSTLMPEEKNIQLLLSEKFLNHLRPYIWFLMAKFHESLGYESLVKDIRTSLMEYMEKSRIADYIALNVIELATNAEISNLKREARILFKGEVDMNAVLFDTEVRRQVQDSLQQRGEIVSISWNMGLQGASIDTQGRMQITINNMESEGVVARDPGQGSKIPDLKTCSLGDFYKASTSSGSNTELGQYYLAYLEETCEKVNVTMESMVKRFPGTDLTTVSLIIGL